MGIDLDIKDLERVHVSFVLKPGSTSELVLQSFLDGSTFCFMVPHLTKELKKGSVAQKVLGK